MNKKKTNIHKSSGIIYYYTTGELRAIYAIYYCTYYDQNIMLIKIVAYASSS